MNPFETLIPNKNTNVNNPFLSLTKEPETEKVKGGFLGEVLTGNTQRFGKTIGEAIASKKNVSDFQNALKSHTDFSESLKKLIITNKKSGKDTSKLEKTLTEHLKSTPSLEAFTGDVINKSTQNILGEALGTAVEMTGVGAIKGVKGIGLVKNITKTAEEANKARQAFNALSTGQKGVSILKDTSRLLGSTLPFGYGYDVSAGLQGQRGEDKTGLNALKPGAGTLLSGVIPVGVGGLRFGRVLAGKTLPYVVSNISGEPIEAYQRRQTGQLEDLMKGGSKEKTLVEARDAVTKFRVGMIEEFGNSIDDVSQQFQGTRIGFDDTNISKLKKVSDAFGFELPQNIRSLSGKETAELLTNLSESYIPNASTLNDVRMNSLVKNLRDSLKSKAVNAFGGKDGLFAKTYQNYAIKSDIYKDISSIVGKVGRRTPLQINASQNRLYNIFKENNTAYLQAVKNFEQATGTRILDRVAVDHLSNIIPKTLRSPTSNVLGWAGDVFSLITFPLSSPKVGSSIVKFISGMDEPVLSKALNKIPGARKAIYDAVYKENMSFNDAVRRYLKNPKVGMSIEDVSKKSLKGKGVIPTTKSLEAKGITPKAYKGEKDLTTKILKDLEGKTTVSKQYILDATNRGELKQVERDLIRQVLDDMDNPPEYAMSHRPSKTGAIASDISKNGEVIPKDVYEHPEWYGNMKDKTYQESFSVLKKIRGNPNAEVTIYRSSPKNELKNGDWVTLSKTYADEEGLKEGVKTHAFKVKAKDIQFAGDDINEFGYYPDTINVSDFAKKVKAELLPLKVSKNPNGTRYENISLQPDVRGSVKDYSEHIYQSPIKTSAGQTHFGDYSYDKPSAPNYFGHTRIEDMADNKTRRVIEVQSDLYQKGNLESEFPFKNFDEALTEARSRGGKELQGAKGEAQAQKLAKQWMKEQDAGKKLQQYNDPTAHFRMIREEIKKAAQDGKTKLQFPTGETAMKIEGLGENRMFTYLDPKTRENIPLTIEKLSTGKQITMDNSEWIITDVLGDGKFKAVPKDGLQRAVGDETDTMFSNTNDMLSYGKQHAKDYLDDYSETFDISGKVDTSNPIYKFYEKDVQKYLSKFGGKRIVDDKGVSWIEVPIKKEWAKMPVEAFAVIAGVGLTSQVDTK